MPHHEVLFNNRDLVVAKLNPRAYIASPVFGSHARPSTFNEGTIIINTMYNEGGKPIGNIGIEGRVIDSVSHSKGKRPLIVWPGLSMEVGPIMVMHGKPHILRGFISGGFQHDVVRETDQVAYGHTRQGKIVVAYAKAHAEQMMYSVTEIVRARNADDPLEWLVKCDGGHAACLIIHDQGEVISRGRAWPVIGAMLAPKV